VSQHVSDLLSQEESNLGLCGCAQIGVYAHAEQGVRQGFELVRKVPRDGVH